MCIVVICVEGRTRILVGEGKGKSLEREKHNQRG